MQCFVDCNLYVQLFKKQSQVLSRSSGMDCDGLDTLCIKDQIQTLMNDGVGEL